MVPKGWVHYRHDGEAWLQAGKKPEATARAHISNIIRKQGELRMAWTFGLSKPVPSDIVLQQDQFFYFSLSSHHLRTKYSNDWDDEQCVIETTIATSTCKFLLCLFELISITHLMSSKNLLEIFYKGTWNINQS